MKYRSIIAAAILAASTLVHAEDATWTEQVRAVDPNAEMIQPGVFASENRNGMKVYASGRNGMEFMKAYIDDLLADHNNERATEDLATLENMSAQLADALKAGKGPVRSSRSGFDTQASHTGFLCGVTYDLEATAQNYGFWYIEASASAGFTQFHPLLGPPPPGGAALVVSTYAETVTPNGTTTDSDSKTFPVLASTIPPPYVEADPAYALGGLGADCMTSEAISMILPQNCHGSFKAISENFSMHCD